MERHKRESFLARCKSIASRHIDGTIDVLSEKRCAICTTPFLPSTPSSLHHSFVPWEPPSQVSSTAKPSGHLHAASSLWAKASPADPHAATTHALAPSLLSGISHDEAFAARCFCPDCARELPRITLGHCPLCGELSPWPLAPKSLCLSCLKRRPPWESLTFHGPYDGLLRKMILHHKFSNILPLGHVLGRLLAQHPALAEIHFDTIVPVPLHAQRLRQRGYNQALEIAKGFLSARKHRAVILPDTLHRTQPTRPQMGLSQKERLHNVRGAFSVQGHLKNRHILLLDDVYTTGSTLRECAAELHKAGAASVHVATLSRTRRRHVFS